MASNNGTAEIVNMEDARARRRAADLDPAGFPDAGLYLAGVREAAGVTLDQLAVRTHIKAAYLKAIEDLDLDLLPNRAFALGFVKTYAEALGLNPADVVARFKSDAGLGAPLEIETEKFEAAEAAASEAERKDLSLWAVIGIVVFIVWCAWQITRPRSEATPFGLEAGPAAQTAAPVVSPQAPRAGAPAALARVVEPVLIERIEPVYPRRCESEAGLVESVEIAFNITRGGVVSGERVASASNACFNDAALNAVRRWRFSPRTVDGEAAPAYDQRYTISFDRPR